MSDLRGGRGDLRLGETPDPVRAAIIARDGLARLRADPLVNRPHRVTILAVFRRSGMALRAGLAGVTQDSDGALCPVAGWHLAAAAVEIDDVIDRIVRDHKVTPPQADPLEVALWWNTPAEIAAIYRRIGSATLFNGAWRLLSAASRRRVRRGNGSPSLWTIIELGDGRSIAEASDSKSKVTHWVVCRIVEEPPTDDEWADDRCRLADPPAQIPVYGTSLALLLDTALDSDGDITCLETSRLDQLA